MTEFEKRYISARRSVIARDFEQLNEMQRVGALTTEGPLLLLAGAGSGKTTVLIQRIYNLLTYGRGSDTEYVPPNVTEDDLRFLEEYPAEPAREDRVRARDLCAVEPAAPWEVLAITFTNKAAGELKARLVERLGSRGHDVWASTFHACCVRILRRDIDRLGFDKSFTIYDTDDSRRVMKELLKERNLDEKTLPIRDVLNEISRAKDQYLTPEQFREEKVYEGCDWRMPDIAKLYAAYTARLKTANALDFDDLIFDTVVLLQTCPDILAYYQEKFRYVLVDEYQDTNHLQYLLTSLLAGGRKNLCVVGDDDQSIYRFRGANIENILSFEKQYPGVRTIRLEQNYRSTQNILDAANQVIRNNTGRKGKTLWTENGIGEKVLVRSTNSEGEEAAEVVSDIIRSVQQGHRFRDHAVLYRVNALSNALEQALRRNGIAYKVIGGMKFFDRAEVKDMLAYLCVINNPLDTLRVLRIINNPPRGIGNATLERVTALAEQEGVTIFEIVRNADLFPDLQKVQGKLVAFANLIDGLRADLPNMALPDFYDAVCERSGYVRALQEKTDMESRNRLENVQELRSNIVSFMEQVPPPEDPTLMGFLNEIALYTDLDDIDKGDEDCVTLMTMHAAKGLEFPVVYVIGMEDGLFPSIRSMGFPEALEEERRLCYVAMTRAKERLTLSRCAHRMLYGYTNSNPASRFLGELPEENIERQDQTLLASDPMEGMFDNPAASKTGSLRSAGDIRTSIRNRRERERQQRTAARTGAGRLKPILVLEPGDRVQHKAFGEGVVQEVQFVGGDILITIEFAERGLKKLMLKTAASYMKKLQ